MIPDNYSKYEELVQALSKELKCGFCGTVLREEDIDMYDHNQGIPVMGHLEKQWVYVRCQNNDCKYAWSFDKLLRRARLQGKVTYR